MKTLIYYFAVSTLILSFGCIIIDKNDPSETNRQLECLMNSVSENRNTEAADIFVSSLRDSFDYWVNNIDITMIKSYSEYDYFVPQSVVFNDEKNQGVGFVIRYRHDLKPFDDIQIITAELIDKTWHFYYLSNFNVHITNRNWCTLENGKTPVSYIESKMLDLLVGTLNFYKSGTCQINPDFFDSRINEEARYAHKHMFLSGTYPKFDIPPLD